MPRTPVIFFYDGSYYAIIVPNCPSWGTRMSPRYGCGRELCPYLAHVIPDYFGSLNPHQRGRLWLLEGIRGARREPRVPGHCRVDGCAGCWRHGWGSFACLQELLGNKI